MAYGMRFVLLGLCLFILVPVTSANMWSIWRYFMKLGMTTMQPEAMPHFTF